MKAVKNVAIILIVAGFLGLAYGSFSYTMKVNQTMMGSLALSIKEKTDGQRPGLGWCRCDIDWRYTPGL